VAAKAGWLAGNGVLQERLLTMETVTDHRQCVLMVPGVGGRRRQLEVRRTVVELIAVPVVHDFVRLQWAAQPGFHDQAMQVVAPPVQRHDAVPVSKAAATREAVASALRAGRGSRS
jgi:hypothetical protein